MSTWGPGSFTGQGGKVKKRRHNEKSDTLCTIKARIFDRPRPLTGWHGMAWDERGGMGGWMGRGPDAGAVVRLWVPGFRTVGCWLLLLLDRCVCIYVCTDTFPETRASNYTRLTLRSGASGCAVLVLVLPIVGLCFVLSLALPRLAFLALPCPGICA